MQSWLSGQRDVLAAAGLGLSEAAGARNNRNLVMAVQAEPDHLMRRIGLHDAANANKEFTDLPSLLGAEIQAAKARGMTRFLFTSEHFHSRLKTHAEIAALKALLAPSFDRFRVIVYLREQSDLRRSLYSTALSKGYLAVPDEFQEDADATWPYYNYQALLERWAAVFGDGAIEPIVFAPDAFEHGDVRRDFIAHVAPDIDRDALVFSREDPFNTAMSLEVAQLAYAFNAAMPGPDGTAIAHQRRARVMTALRMAPGAHSPLILPHAHAMHDRFDGSNTRMALRFFGQNTSPFARPDTPDHPVLWTDISPGQGARLRAIAAQFDAHHKVQDEIDGFDATGGTMDQAIALIETILAPPPVAPPRTIWQWVLRR